MQQELLYVYEVYREGSFSKAAEKLFVSQPALSIAIKKLEDRYGTPLFDRSKKPLEPTEAGKIYIDKIEKMRRLEKELEEELHDLNHLKTGRLRLGGTQYFNAYILPPVFRLLMDRYPGIQMELTEEPADSIAQRLLDGSIDLMFSAAILDSSLFTCQEVFSDCLLLTVPQHFSVNQTLSSSALTRDMILAGKHLASDCPTVPLHAFHSLPFLFLTKENDLHQRATAMCREAGFQPRVIMKLQQFVTAYHLCCQGMAAAFSSDLLIKSSMEYPCLYYKISSPLIRRTFFAVGRKGGYQSNAARIFIQMIRQYYRDSVNSFTAGI